MQQHLGVKGCSAGPVPQRPAGQQKRIHPHHAGLSSVISSDLITALSLSPGVAVAPEQTGLQLREDETELGLQPDGVLDQFAFIAQVDPAALQVLLHHLLELLDSLHYNNRETRCVSLSQTTGRAGFTGSRTQIKDISEHRQDNVL